MSSRKNLSKIRIALLYGGQSAEHDVSIESAKNIFSELIKIPKYEVIPIYITRQGNWSRLPGGEKLLLLPKKNNSKNKKAVDTSKELTASTLKNIDVIFPIIHGTFGEDGTIQALAKLMGIPCVGAGVLGSAINMDKDVMKRLLRDAKVPIADFVTISVHEKIPEYFEIKNKLGASIFIKPANMGSSIGIGKAKNETEYRQCLKNAFRFDNKVIIEKKIIGREIECSVLGNEKPVASAPGEVINTKHEFYDYQAKYSDNEGVKLIIPAQLTVPEVKEIQAIALKTYKTLEAEGMARVDMFLKKNGQVVVNEINTIPGFTRFSMYPKMWQASGISQKQLLSRLISLAIKSFAKSPFNRSWLS